MKKKLIYFFILSVVVLLVISFFSPNFKQDKKNQNVSQESETNQNVVQSGVDDGVPVNQDESKKIIAKNLKIPWEIVFLPNGQLLVTERVGRLVKIDQKTDSIQVESVIHQGEGGLLGMALHPKFEENQWLYLYLTTKVNDKLENRVLRFRYQQEDHSLSQKEVILDQIPASTYHNGGRIAFGPDGFLYITTGDASQENLAQDKNSLAGKILKITDEGQIPSDNPFSNEVYSYGHRNPQGLAWDDQGRLWATEHGPSGAQSGLDELNLITKGGNYGWPVIRGDESQADMITPVIQSGSDETWAPAGAVFDDTSVFFTGLRGSTLYEYSVTEEKLRRHLVDEFGRLRVIVKGPDGYFYMATSNTDGRGTPAEDDDMIVRVGVEGVR